MKALCIDASTDFDSELPVDLIEGIVYTVKNILEEDGIVWYQLAEKPNSDYSEDAFIPTSNINEKEFERNYNKELV